MGFLYMGVQGNLRTVLFITVLELTDPVLGIRLLYLQGLGLLPGPAHLLNPCPHLQHRPCHLGRFLPQLLHFFLQMVLSVNDMLEELVCIRDFVR